MILDSFAWPDRNPSSTKKGLPSPNSDPEQLGTNIWGRIRALTALTLIYLYYLYKLERKNPCIANYKIVPGISPCGDDDGLATFYGFLLYIFGSEKLRENYDFSYEEISYFNLNTREPDISWASFTIWKLAPSYTGPDPGLLHVGLKQPEQQTPPKPVTDINLHEAFRDSLKVCPYVEEGSTLYGQIHPDMGNAADALMAMFVELNGIRKISRNKRNATSIEPPSTSETPGSLDEPDPEISSSDDYGSWLKVCVDNGPTRDAIFHEFLNVYGSLADLFGEKLGSSSE